MPLHSSLFVAELDLDVLDIRRKRNTIVATIWSCMPRLSFCRLWLNSKTMVSTFLVLAPDCDFQFATLQSLRRIQAIQWFILCLMVHSLSQLSKGQIQVTASSKLLKLTLGLRARLYHSSFCGVDIFTQIEKSLVYTHQTKWPGGRDVNCGSKRNTYDRHEKVRKSHGLRRKVLTQNRKVFQ